MPGNGKHWLLYDGNCRLCLGMVKRWRGTLESRGFAFASLHEEWVGERLGVAGPELLSEMRVLCGSGRILGGVEAFVFLWSKVWWCWPLWRRTEGPWSLPPRSCVGTAMGVLAAVGQDRGALEFASAELRGDREVVQGPAACLR